MQRLRIRFGRGEALKYISHLDLIRLWQRIFHRAGLPLAYSEGFVPHPRISLAAPLALGVTSEAELMDIHFIQTISPYNIVGVVKPQMPAGLELFQVMPMALLAPSLQSLMQYAEYNVQVESDMSTDGAKTAISKLLKLAELPWQHQRDTGVHHYDLRSLVDDIWLVSQENSLVKLGMRLRCDSSGSGRPEQVTAALGFTNYPLSVHRTRLILSAK